MTQHWMNQDAQTMTDLFPLQGLLWPERGISTEREVYFRLTGAAGYSEANQHIIVGPGGKVSFETAFNLFNLSKWRNYCDLHQLTLRLHAEGKFELSVLQAIPDNSWERIYSDVIQIEPNVAFDLDLTPLYDADKGGSLMFTLTSLGDGRVIDAEWMTTDQPRRMPTIALSITTFKREKAVRESVRRFEEYIRDSRLAPFLHMLVVDNGQSANIEHSANVTPILNENLGGSGGFARGLLEVERLGMTHCLFMDDDASIHMEALDRVWTFLAYATDPATAIAGGLTMANHRWAVWENGAIFNGHCQPQHLGTDLRAVPQVLAMEEESSKPKPQNYYGGWWFFAFPVERAIRRPFPYFVRGDDVGFSIVNDFNITTLPGVMSFQDANFSDKESLQTLYLDLRSHMANHLAIPNLDISSTRLSVIPLRFFARSYLQCHYETIEALNMSLEDLMTGPDFFAANADMAARRADLNKIRKDEAWKPLTGPAPRQKIRFDPHKTWVRLLMKATLNGHLLPFFRYYGNHRVLMAGDRGRIRETWGAAKITYLDGKGQYFTVTHSKGKALKQGWRFFRNLVSLNARHDEIKRKWREGYPQLASNQYWNKRLGLTRDEA